MKDSRVRKEQNTGREGNTTKHTRMKYRLEGMARSAFARERVSERDTQQFCLLVTEAQLTEPCR